MAATMVIECETCRSRFRLDTGLFKGARAIRVRCRKCGGGIVAMNPDIPEPLHVPAVEEAPEAARAPAEAPPEKTAAPAEKRIEEPAPSPTRDAEPYGLPPFVEAAEDEARAFFVEEAPLPFGLSGDGGPEAARPSPPEGPEDEGPSHPLEEPEEEAPPSPPEAVDDPARAFFEQEGEPARSGDRISSLLEQDPARSHPAPHADSETFSSALNDLFSRASAGEPVPRTGRVLETEKHVPPFADPKSAAARPPYMQPLFLVGVGLWLLLLAGGALYFGTAGGSLFSSSGSAPAGAAGRPVYDVRDVKWDILRRTDAGDLFVVRGTVVNAGPGESAGIRIQATLLGKDNEALGERDVFAGNTIDDTTLQHAPASVLKAALNKRYGDGDRNKGIPRGGSLPFMVVFFDPPPDIGSVLVKGVDAP